MKIRHKQNGTEINLAPVWEVVKPEPAWRNATDECLGVMYHVPAGYRLFKVWAHGLHPDANAFLMEKREP